MTVDQSTRLARRLGMFDAAVLGIGAMLGAGVFVAFAPAAAAAGSARALMLGLALAAIVAACNAYSSAQLAVRYPRAGGTYVYGREQLSHVWGFVAGWGFVCGKVASCTAAALAAGHYLAPAHPHVVASCAALALTVVNYLGVQRTAAMTKLLLAPVLAALAVAVGAALANDPGARIGSVWAGDAAAMPVLAAAAVCFFAFAGYARIATLGEEVQDPARTIPRAVLLSLAATLVIYAAVAATLLATMGVAGVAQSPRPLVDAVGGAPWATTIVGAGAAIAALGVLLSLLAGVSRTIFAMAAEDDLPRWFSAVHPTHRIPHRAELTIGGIVTALAAVSDVRSAITFSAFTILLYYAIANASALRLGDAGWHLRTVAAIGLTGCLLLAASLDIRSIALGACVLAGGLLLRWLLLQRVDRHE